MGGVVCLFVSLEMHVKNFGGRPAIVVCHCHCADCREDILFEC